MKHLWLILFVTLGLVWGQDLHFKNNRDEIIKIIAGQNLHINEHKYTLLKTDYSKQYVLVKKYNSQIQDTLTFDSIVSFKYYEKSLESFASSVIKGAKYGVIIGAIVGLPEALNYGVHWIVFGSVVHGSLGVMGGAMYGIIIPRKSDQLILIDEEWEIIE